ncbi:hypothetical protein [Aquabacterium sp.]|uniref:hypothetical protein n=1 Tax=Aquabacterium sp. TaxID=1872578 RepID=UPI0035C67B08
MFRTAIRLSAAAAVIGFAAPSVQANLTLPIQFTQSNSVQAFPLDNREAFDLIKLTVEGRGTTYVAAQGAPGSTNGTVTPAAFGFPITKIVIGPRLNIVSGSAVGSALFFQRFNDDNGETVGLTLANFTIHYDRKQVLADTTPVGGTTQVQMPIYDFTTLTPLALKYKFPLAITGHEVLGNLKLTPQVKDVMRSVLQLPEFTEFALEFDYGTLTQDISTNLRSRPVSTRPYVAK